MVRDVSGQGGEPVERREDLEAPLEDRVHLEPVLPRGGGAEQ